MMFTCNQRPKKTDYGNVRPVKIGRLPRISIPTDEGQMVSNRNVNHVTLNRLFGRGVKRFIARLVGSQRRKPAPNNRIDSAKRSVCAHEGKAQRSMLVRLSIWLFVSARSLAQMSARIAGSVSALPRIMRIISSHSQLNGSAICATLSDIANRPWVWALTFKVVPA